MSVWLALFTRFACRIPCGAQETKALVELATWNREHVLRQQQRPRTTPGGPASAATRDEVLPTSGAKERAQAMPWSQQLNTGSATPTMPSAGVGATPIIQAPALSESTTGGGVLGVTLTSPAMADPSESLPNWLSLEHVHVVPCPHAIARQAQPPRASWDRGSDLYCVQSNLVSTEHWRCRRIARHLFRCFVLPLAFLRRRPRSCVAGQLAAQPHAVEPPYCCQDGRQQRAAGLPLAPRHGLRCAPIALAFLTAPCSLSVVGKEGGGGGGGEITKSEVEIRARKLHTPS